MASTPLASPSDLCTRLGRETPGAGTPERNQMEALLNDASAEIRAVIGQTLTRAESTVTLNPDGSEERRRFGRQMVMSYIELPAVPVISITKVEVDDVELVKGEYFVRQRTLFLPQVYPDSEVEITYVHGFSEVPEDLIKWTCFLAAAVISAAEKTDSLGVTAGLSQHAQTIDDYTESFANYTGDRMPGLSLPPDIAARLKAIYGLGGITTVSFR